MDTKKGVHFVKITMARKYEFNQIWFDSTVFHIRLCKTASKYPFNKYKKKSINNQFNKKYTKFVYPKVNPQHTIVCLEQKIYANPENFTPALLVTLETFRRSGYKIVRKKTLVLASYIKPWQEV